ncbi:MAG: 4-hydroxythreonine-4-phosphate dehydrogenase PdxA [Deltaproteobacteria bacterium]|nr:4-hydroxythreonine-4-phosphate dehydrogenase PdxA [Deltaproteobacteria bacterium]
MQASLPKIGISMGDPAGIGPEIILKALTDEKVLNTCLPLVIGDSGVLHEMAKKLDIPFPLTSLDTLSDWQDNSSPAILSLTSLQHAVCGEVSKSSGHASGLYIQKAAELALGGEIDGIVTAPINKESFNLGGFDYPGHTEFLAHLTKTENYAMMLMGETLRVVLLTIHCPLMEVAGRLTREDTIRIIRLSHETLKTYFAIENPRIALASLNPHAGEGGLFGEEEEQILIPASRMAREEGIDVTEPLPADTLFFSAVRGKYDIVVCPYHDQGLIPLKLLHFEDGVNVTLGLPIVRTSPDHGTAFDIAGKGLAKPESIKAAIFTALTMIRAKKTSQGGIAYEK